MKQSAKFAKRNPDAHRAQLAVDVARAVTKSKYRNVKTWVGTECFDSKREAEYWVLLKARESLNEIEGLKRQQSYPLLCPARDEPIAPGEARVVAHYVADFIYHDADTGRLHIVDAKGAKTRTYLMKKKWLELQDGLMIEEV